MTSLAPRLALAIVLILGSAGGILLHAVWRHDPQAEARLCGVGLCDSDQLITGARQDFGDTDPVTRKRAISAFRTALQRDPAYPYRWADLGEALLADGDAGEAGICLAKAVQLAPNSPPILLRAATFYLRNHDQETALGHMSHILHVISEYDEIIFSTYQRLGIPVEQVLQQGIPQAESRPLRSYLEHVLRFQSPDDMGKVWKAVMDRNLVDDKLAAQYTSALLRNHRYEAARQAWAEYLAGRRGDYPEANGLFNGGFESGFSGGELDWQWSYSEHVTEIRDETTAHDGRTSLRVAFDGKANISYAGVSQRAVVEPGLHRLYGWIKASGITTDQGVALRVFDPEAPDHLDVKTSPVLGTTDWRRFETSFVVPRITRTVTIQVVRQPAWKFDNQISGMVWLDSLRLTAAQ